MKLDLNGSFEVPSTMDETWSLLTDPDRMVPLLPMYREHRLIEAGRFSVILEVGVPQVKGKVEAQVQMHTQVPGRQALFVSSAKHVLGMADSEISFDLEKLNHGTQVRWTSATVVRGTLASLANGLLEPLARRNVQAMIDALSQALAGPVVPEPSLAQGQDDASLARRRPVSWWRRLLAWLSGSSRSQA